MRFKRQLVAAGGDGLGLIEPFCGRATCDRLPPVATTGLHKGSILRCQTRRQRLRRRRSSPHPRRVAGRSPTATHTPRANLVRRRLDFVARPLLPAIRRPDRCVREDDPLVGHRGPYAVRRALHGGRPPGLVLVREPDELGLERAHPQLALRARLVELAEANGHVTADDAGRPPVSTTITCMPRVWPG